MGYHAQLALYQMGQKFKLPYPDNALLHFNLPVSSQSWHQATENFNFRRLVELLPLSQHL